MRRPRLLHLPQLLRLLHPPQQLPRLKPRRPQRPRPPAAAASAPAEAPVALDARVQQLKADVIRLNRDLLVLEEELLFPAGTQVALFVSMDVGKLFDVFAAGLAANLRRGLGDVADKTRPRLRFIGYTRNERLARRTAGVYEDDVGLSASRARRAMEQIADEMKLESSQAEFEGRGFVHSDDVVNAGFIDGDTSYVSVQVVYDELALLDDYEGVDITRMTREVSPENPLALNMMRITVDGKPIDDPKRSSADIQRCTDVALAKAEIQFGFDNLKSAPRLSVSAEPERIVVVELDDGETIATDVQFRMYTNYSHFVDRAEIRVFETGQSLESEPLDIIELKVDGTSRWRPTSDDFRAPVQKLAYVLRAYGADGKI